MNDLVVRPCSFGEAAAFVVKHHYMCSTKGITPTHCYQVTNRVGVVVGAAIFGKPAYRGTEARYSGGLRLVELRRFVLLDECPRNSESKVLGMLLRLLREEGIQRVLSYADPNQKRNDHPEGRHTGLIYRATGFRQVTKAKRTKAVWFNGRRYPIRNLDQYRQYDGGEPLTPLSRELRAALKDGRAELRVEEGRIGYLRDLVESASCCVGGAQMSGRDDQALSELS